MYGKFLYNHVAERSFLQTDWCKFGKHRRGKHRGLEQKGEV